MDAPRTILLISYLFPPRAGAGAQRPLKFAKYLPEFGWRPVVLANGGTAKDNMTAVQDPTLLAELPECVSVNYTKLTAAEEHAFRRQQSWLGQRMQPTDPIAWWVAPAVRTALDLIHQNSPAAIMVTMSPFSAAEAGIQLKRLTGLPLVLDLRDPWAMDEMRIYPTRLHAWRDWRAMRRALAAADLVIMNTPEALRAARKAFGRVPPVPSPAEYTEWQRRPAADSEAGRLCHLPPVGAPAALGKMVCITNGFDPADYGHHPIVAAPPDVLRIVHTGGFHSEMARRWDDLNARRGLVNKLKHPRRPINLWTRTPRYLLEAIDKLASAGRVGRDKIELILVGEITDEDRALLAASPAASQIKMLGYRSHEESVGWVESGDLLFLPNHTPLDGGPALVVPGKTYEYLGSGRPILAMGGKGDMRDFITAAGAGAALDGEDVAGAADLLERMLAAKREGRKLFNPERLAIAHFERRALAAKLAEELDELTQLTKLPMTQPLATDH